MNNMKKALALVLSMALAASTLVAGAAYSDVTANHDNSVAINLLGDLGVMVGDAETGNFRPEGTLNRAEAAAIVFRLRTAKTNADNYIGTTKFADVTANHWAAGYINYAETQGIINGYPDGSFKPDSKVTYAEFTKMVISALNLQKTRTTSVIVNGIIEDRVDVITTFPTGYIAIADDQKVNDGITLSQDDPADRAAVAQMAYNAIFEADYLKQVGDNIDNATSLANSVFKLNEVKGIVSAFDGDETISLVNVKNSAGVDVGNADYKFKGVSSALIGQEVKVYVKTAGDKNVMAVVATANNTVTTVNAFNVDKDNGAYFYTNADGKKQFVNAADFVAPGAKGTQLVVNGKVINAPANYTTIETLLAALTDTKMPAQITFVDNNDTTKTPEYIKIDLYSSAKIDSVEKKAIYIADTKNMAEDAVYTALMTAFDGAATDGKITTIDSNDEKVKKVTFYDGVAAKDKVSVYKDANGTTVITKLKTIEGTLSRISGSTYTIGGEDYKATKAAVAELVGKSGSAVKLTVDPMTNLIIKAEGTDALVEDYYYVEKVAAGTGVNTTVQAKVYNSKGEKLILDVKSDAGLAEGVTGTYKLEVNSKKEITKATATDTGLTTTKDTSITKSDAYNAKTKLFQTAAKTFEVSSNTVTFVKQVKNDEVKVYVGDLPKFKIADPNNAKVTVNADGNKAKVIFVDGLDVSGTTSTSSNIFGYVIKTEVEYLADKKAEATYTIATQGEVKTLKTGAVDVSDLSGKESLEKTFVKFDLGSDNIILIDDLTVLATNDFKAAGPAMMEDEFYTGKITKSADTYIIVGGQTIELAENVQMYIKDGKETRVTTSISESNNSYNRIAYFTVTGENDKAKVKNIFVESVDISADSAILATEAAKFKDAASVAGATTATILTGTVETGVTVDYSAVTVTGGQTGLTATMNATTGIVTLSAANTSETPAVATVTVTLTKGEAVTTKTVKATFTKAV